MTKFKDMTKAQRMHLRYAVDARRMIEYDLLSVAAKLRSVPQAWDEGWEDTGGMGLFFDPIQYELLRISLPITGAYLATILAWMAVADELNDKRKISWQSRTVFKLVVYAMFFMLFIAPVYLQTERSADVQAVKTFYSFIELVFGGAMGVIARDFFGHGPDKSSEAKREVNR